MLCLYRKWQFLKKFSLKFQNIVNVAKFLVICQDVDSSVGTELNDITCEVCDL